MMGCLFALVLNSPKVKVWLTKGLTPSAVSLVAVLIMATGGRSFTPMGRSIQSTLMRLLIVSTVLNLHAWLGRLLEFPALRWFGRLSYSHYVWQQLFSVRGISPWYSVQTATLLVVAGISFHCIERPMMRLGYKLTPPSTLAHKDLGVKSQ
jgi:peptidoglycan/LPS O-acetylase OafA/YrhL